MHQFCIRAIISAIFVSFVLSAQLPNPSNNKNIGSLPIVEGSGAPISSSKDNKNNVVAADIDWEASGVGPDDEDGDVNEEVEGSGSSISSNNSNNPVEVEGSGIPNSQDQLPSRTTTTIGTPKEKIPSSTTITSRLPSSSTAAIATTVITITTEETKRQEEEIFNVQKPLDDNELKFGENEDDDDDDDDDDEDDDETEVTTSEATTTQKLTTSTISTTTTTTTKKPPSIAIGTEPSPILEDGDEDDAFHNMFKPGILAAITGGAVVGILLAILLVMFIVYRIRKKDEGSYSVDETSHHPPNYSYAYQKAATKEFYA
jgi:hypothetical protein